MNQSADFVGMIPVEEFAKRKGLAVDRAIAMIRDGVYVGQIVGVQWYAREDQIESRSTKSRSTSGAGGNAPEIVALFYVLSGLSLLGGLILAWEFWPGDPGYGKEWEPVAYVWSVIWIMAGIIEAGLFAAIGKGLSLLEQIARNTEK